MRQLAGRVVVVVNGDADLLEVVRAGHAVGGFPHLLHGGEQQSYEDANDRNDHQQLDQRKARATCTTRRSCATHGVRTPLRERSSAIRWFRGTISGDYEDRMCALRKNVKT